MPDHAKLEHLVVNIRRPTPQSGMAQLVTKLKGPEKDLVDTAAAGLGLTQAEFLRTVLVSAAEYAITQLGLTVTETGKFIELRSQEIDNGTV